MVCMFKTLEDTWLRGFLEGTTYVFESAVTEFFLNARVLVGTIVSTVCGQKLVVTEETFSATFKLPTEGMANFAGIQKETIAKMKYRFSATENPKKQSHGYIVPVSMLMEILVKADLGPSIKLHAKKMLTSKQVENYIKTNQGIAPEGEPTSVRRTHQVTLRVERHKVHNQYNRESQSHWQLPQKRMCLTPRKGNNRDTAQVGSHKIEQSGNENTEITFHEHQAQETEPTIQTDEPWNEWNEHQAPAEPRSVPGIDQNLEDRSAITPLAQIVSDHRDPDPSNLQLVDTTSSDSSTLQLMNTAAKSLNDLSTLLVTMADPDPGVHRIVILLASRRMAPTSFTRKSALQTVAAVDRQSGPRPESRHLRQPALEGLTNSARTKTPLRGDRNKSYHVDGGTRRRHGAAAGGIKTPSSACTRRTDEFSTDENSSSR
ncbi:hypothetical protein F511_17923 [Dorcoceras hygrometricum]|uniref:Uncharacterized protein n=1 Tax=Dorcoceras hygrometricum TaxID=472368 RepID=A0A2Z7BVA9_9LAMI|nr:hypothetical protein F511_17923 [Dorcoceras hygrometricum]